MERSHNEEIISKRPEEDFIILFVKESREAIS